MSYLTLEAAIEHGQVIVKEPGRLPEKGRGLLTILSVVDGGGQERTRERVRLPLIHGDGRRRINPTREELDASLWD